MGPPFNPAFKGSQTTQCAALRHLAAYQSQGRTADRSTTRQNPQLLPLLGKATQGSIGIRRQYHQRIRVTRDLALEISGCRTRQKLFVALTISHRNTDIRGKHLKSLQLQTGRRVLIIQNHLFQPQSPGHRNLQQVYRLNLIGIRRLRRKQRKI